MPPTRLTAPPVTTSLALKTARPPTPAADIAVPAGQAFVGALAVGVTAASGPAAVTQIASPAAAVQPAGHARAGARIYVVRPGDTLAGIARRFYGRQAAWPWLWHLNRGSVGVDPGLLEAGRVLRVPHDHPDSYRDWAPPPSSVGIPAASYNPGGGSVVASAAAPQHEHHRHAQRPAAAESFSSGGTYGLSALEQVWMSAGGSAATAPHAACIAQHESGGNPRAISPQDDAGLWQIASSNAPTGQMLDPAANAAKAVAMSSNGTSWSAWSTAGDC